MADNIARRFTPYNFIDNSVLPPPPSTSIRLSVEPVQVELESADGSLLFSAVQSAFPHATGIYFRPKGADCRAMLKFDGRRFVAPNGGWNNGMEYFVELGGNRPNPFPFGSYEHASKQFERSVNLVQQMMNGSSIQLNGKKARIGSGGHQQIRHSANAEGQQLHSSNLPSTHQPNQNIDDGLRQNEIGEFLPANRQILLKDNEENEHFNHPQNQQYPQLSNERRKSSSGLTDLTLISSQSTARDAKSIERDFADLARICAGKDAVIDGQRLELDSVKCELDRLKKIEAEWAESETEWKAKWEVAERELEMLRTLGRDQQGLHGQIVELQGELERERATWQQGRGELEMEMRRWEREAQEWKDKNELATWTINELTEQSKRTQREKADLQKKLAILEEQVNGEAMEFSRRFQERERIQQELLADNTRLYQIKDQLELKVKELKEKLVTQFDKRIEEIKAEYEAKEQKLRDNLAIADSTMAQLNAKIAELCAQKEEAEKQIQSLKNHSELGNSEPLFAYSQG